MPQGLNSILPVAIMVVITIIALGIGSQVIASVASDNCESGYTYNETTDTCYNSTGQWNSGAGDSYAVNVSNNGLQGTSELASWTPTIALVFAAALIIGVLVMSFGRT